MNKNVLDKITNDDPDEVLREVVVRSVHETHVDDRRVDGRWFTQSTRQLHQPPVLKIAPGNTNPMPSAGLMCRVEKFPAFIVRPFLFVSLVI